MSKKSALDLLKMKADSTRITMVTAYDYSMAKIVDAAGVDMVLVGDSLGMVIQGMPDTLSVTLDDMAYHGRCVARGLENAHLTVDLPFMSYQISPEQALQSAGRLVQQGKAQSVKLEGGARSVAAVERIVSAGIPVVAHLGLTPQSVHTLGGWKVQGRGAQAAEQLLQDALALQDAGAFALVLEMVPAELAAQVSAALEIPTIGIGAGVHCDGQVLVINDLLGFDLGFSPRFLKRYAELQPQMVQAVQSYVEEVRTGEFPTSAHSFHRRRGPAKLAKVY